MTTHTVAVYGAAGHTGRFVASELERRGVAVRRVARSVPEVSSSPDARRAANMVERYVR